MLKDGYEKLKINCVIGPLKPTAPANLKTLAIGTDRNTIYYHYLRAKASFTETFVIDDITYYQMRDVYETYETQSEETETPIYNSVITNSHELLEGSWKKGGRVWDLNTDWCTCTFKDDVVQFELDGSGNTKGY